MTSLMSYIILFICAMFVGGKGLPPGTVGSTVMEGDVASPEVVFGDLESINVVWSFTSIGDEV